MNKIPITLFASAFCFIVYLANNILGSISFYFDSSISVFMSDLAECLFLIATATFFVMAILRLERAEEDN